jgi:glycosyltransferase involved in cell wall biosynthesis
MAPVVSVLLPYREAGETVEEAIGSVLEERGVDLEVIAINDGSRDDGPEKVARLSRGAGAGGRVVMIEGEGRGIAAALTRGLSVARGAFIARMDADDISLPMRIERSLEVFMSDDRLGVVGTRVEAFPEEAVGEGMRRYVAWQNALVTPEDHAREIFIESPLCHPSVTIRRRALDEAGGFRDGPWPEDYDLWLRLDARGFLLAKVPEVRLRWRHRAGRATFSDPRYALARFIEAKGHYLAPRLRVMRALGDGGAPSLERALAVWGAGKTGRRVARAMAMGGATPDLFVDIDPRKIGRTAQGAPIVPPSHLERGRHTVVVAVGARGARDLIREHLDAAGFKEGTDYVCAA